MTIHDVLFFNPASPHTGGKTKEEKKMFCDYSDLLELAGRAAEERGEALLAADIRRQCEESAVDWNDMPVVPAATPAPAEAPA